MDLINWIGGLIAVVSDPRALLDALGPWLLVGVALIVFVESGVLFPFLPGDSLLVAAAVVHGALGAQLWRIVAVCLLAAVAGDQAGYWLGARYGRRLFRDDARILRTDRLEEAEAFFDRHGRVALVLGRFVPIVRTYVPFAAGAARMSYRRFAIWNVLGALAWVGSMTGVGLLLAGVPGVADSIEGVVLAVVAVSLLPVAVPAARCRWRRGRRWGIVVCAAQGGGRGEACTADGASGTAGGKGAADESHAGTINAGGQAAAAAALHRAAALDRGSAFDVYDGVRGKGKGAPRTSGICADAFLGV